MVTPYRKEKKLFAIACVLSALLWLALIVGTFGIALVYLLLFALFYLFVQSAFISMLKGNGVRITPEQFPDLHRQLTACCQRIGLKVVPDTYLLRTDVFNALATRFLGRNFVVLFSDVVDALDERPGAISFYIGHELGHIHRKHLKWGWFVMPASILPLLGAGLRRAQEYTCDRYGVACCDSDEDLRAAIAAMAAGNTRWKSINVDAWLGQIADTTGFWMSYNELTSDYPWLTKRMATALALRRGDELVRPSRHLGAKLLAAVTPRIGVGGGSGLFVAIVIIGVLAAVAIPAYQDYTVRASIASALGEANQLQTQVVEYYEAEGDWPPPNLTTLGYASDEPLAGTFGNYTLDIYDAGLIGIDVSAVLGGEEQFVVLEPQVENGNLNWICYSQNINLQLLPSGCQ